MRNHLLSYLTTIPDEPRETYSKRRVEQYRQALIDHPEDELHLLQCLMVWISLDEDAVDETISIAQRIFSLDIEKKYSSEVYIALGRAYLDKKETAKAIEYYRKAIEANKDSEDIIMELAQIFEEQKDYRNAFLTFDLLNNDAIEGGKELMYRSKGDMYMKNNEWNIASEYYDKAIECCMKYEWIVRTIQGWELSKDYKDDFIEQLKKAMVLEDDAEKAKTNCRLGIIYQDRNDYYLAMHYYSEAIKLNPGFAEAYNNMALLVFENEHDWEKSETLLNKAIKAIEEKSDDEGVDENWNEWLIALFTLNLSRVYSKMTFFKKAAEYRSKFLESMGFGYADDDDDDGDVEADF